MGGVSVDGKDGRYIQSVGEMLGRFAVEVYPKVAQWEERLKDDPQELEAIEREVLEAFGRGAGLVVAGLISVVMQTPQFAEAAEETRQNYAIPLSPGRNQKMSVRVVGGVEMWITSQYCEPRRRKRADDEPATSGLHVEQVQFGFAKKVSPGLESQVSRQAALCPSFELAGEELRRAGVQMNVKTVRRVAEQCGRKLLKLRTSDVMQWRSRKLRSTGELAGKRVTVQIDGGRTKLRGALKAAAAQQERLNSDELVISDAPGRSRKRAKRTFTAEWREPKLMTIFIHNEKGRLEKKTRMTIDGTFAGPDAMAELVAMHLARLGGAKALSITFVADGAVWIWERIDQIVAQAKIPKSVPIYQVLDNCHAVHHISLALASLGISTEERMPLYRELRSQLRDGHWKYVVDELQSLADDDPQNASLQTELNYLRRHGEAGRLDYTQFRSLGLPLGSGAIESNIRRVINLRLKGNGIFWLEEHAEEMLQLRALVITNRWDEQLRRLRTWQKTNYLADWRWTPQLISPKVEHQTKTHQNSA